MLQCHQPVCCQYTRCCTYRQSGSGCHSVCHHSSLCMPSMRLHTLSLIRSLTACHPRLLSPTKGLRKQYAANATICTTRASSRTAATDRKHIRRDFVRESPLAQMDSTVHTAHSWPGLVSPPWESTTSVCNERRCARAVFYRTSREPQRRG